MSAVQLCQLSHLDSTAFVEQAPLKSAPMPEARAAPSCAAAAAPQLSAPAAYVVAAYPWPLQVKAANLGAFHIVMAAMRQHARHTGVLQNCCLALAGLAANAEPAVMQHAGGGIEAVLLSMARPAPCPLPLCSLSASSLLAVRSLSGAACGCSAEPCAVGVACARRGCAAAAREAHNRT